MKTYLYTLALVLATAACGSEEPKEGASRSEAPASAAPASQGSMQGMEGMQGMPGMEGSGTTDQMQAHMRAMHGAGADSLQAMLPMHRQMAANMIAEFNREMRGMNMSGDAAWDATVDSLRQDLVRMPEMGAEELRSFLPGHETRLTRLMEMHRSMMADMKM